MRIKRCQDGLLAILLLLLGSGCLTTTDVQQRNRDMVYVQENFRLLQEENRHMKGRLEGLEIELQRLTAEQRAQRSKPEDGTRASLRDAESRIAVLERQTQQLAQQREQDKKEIVDTLSQKIAKLMQPQASSASKPPPSVKKTERSEFGYEHVVQQGQTLSEIASAYGVSVATLIRENDLKDPNRLHAGQKLFVPEKKP